MQEIYVLCVVGSVLAGMVFGMVFGFNFAFKRIDQILTRTFNEVKKAQRHERD